MPASCRTIHREDGGGTKFPREQSGCPDLNWGPLRPERSALPGCATPRAGVQISATKSARSRHDRRATLAPKTTNGGAVNTVSLIGNLATDVELKDIGDDKKVASFLLAVDRPSQDGGADFVRIAAWNRQAETCAEDLAKGAKVGVEGRLRGRPGEEEEKR